MTFRRITMDFETRSACDLKKSGAYKYSLDSTTRPTCLAFKVHGLHKMYFLDFEMVNTHWTDLPIALKKLWRTFTDENYEFSAHNAFFERCIYENILVKRYGWPRIPERQYRCTAAKAASCALPRNLEGAGAALNLTTQKDKRGYVAMMATCRPTRKWNDWNKLQTDIKSGKRITEARKRKLGWFSADAYELPEPPMFLEPHMAPDVWQTLYTYCKIDVKTEELLDTSLPDLMPFEQEVWFLNQKLNWRGLRIDLKNALKIVDMMSTESVEKLKELDALTMGLVTKPGARKSILEFLAIEGIELPDIRAKTVDDVLSSSEISEDARRLLEIRKALSKTSTRKYQAFLNRANNDGHVRDILLYHGASTGRDTGTGIQAQNFPKPLIKQKEIDYVFSMLADGSLSSDWIKFFYGDLGIVFSSLLRGMVLPDEGHELFVADFSKIEVAVLWWLANNWLGLKILNEGKDPYIYQAAANTGKTYGEIERGVNAGEKWAEDARQLGKAQILGAGFRMGWARFKETAYSFYRLSLTNKESFDAIKKYREANKPVVELWTLYENAAIEAFETKKRIYAGKCVFYYKDRFLWVELPSGRKLAYLDPSLTWRTITYDALETDAKGNEIIVQRTGDPKKTFQHLGLGLSKKDLRIEFKHGGIWAENITQAVARDLMKEGELNLEEAGYKVKLAVHDEILGSRKKGEGSVEEYTHLMCKKPKWVDEHLPLEAKGWSAMRYRK